ncbi:TetR/AcrR family transcriptional regulator [Actinomycetospora cinnamomea]|uniref:TetR family transcriptional regulator n=1 Tax=Actinomycetospora cinnamomea TaxID=663609 RepID=A0A2U1FRX1_9PSEU|nr:TetR/AcrR family transcriptional regulator [Actinomycetospora cinnamomea]PVZ14916.1 TetR family transcriptional regulator [Actinomycetospora cinnamomea]
MPKIVDHDARRHEIAAALWRLAAREGLEAASLASVATEAGVSKGRVQHYFGSREELLAFAATALRERLGERVRARVLAAGSEPLAVVRALLAGLLPLDDDARADALVGSAFLVRAVVDPVARERLRTGEEEILAALADGLARARDTGALAASVDPVGEAEVLHALVGGLADSLLVDRHTPDSALAALDRYLERLA